VIVLSASQLTVRRGGRPILHDIDFRAESGEFVAVIGANGAGKSTLLATIAGLIAPDTGTIRLDGIDVASLTRVQIARRRAYLPQNPRSEWPLAVERLVALGLIPTLPAFGGLPWDMQVRVDTMLEEWDLLAHRTQPATTLSGGELARAMLARALVANPDILIADEPISGLDPRHALYSARRLSDLARGGKLVIASIHDLTLAARYATRIVALDRGSAVADGRPENILTPDLLRSVFEVEACVSGAGENLSVDYRMPVSP
jgi:iron complex transport system ATP-binding protein